MSKIAFVISLLSTILITDACVDVCRGRSDNHFAANPRGCSWYYRCNVGIAAEEGRCPEPFYFNYENQKCDWKENVECTDDRVFPTTCPVVGIVVIAHPNVCSKYTVCMDGNQEDRDCEDGLHFSPYDGKCVEPHLAECTKDREFCLARNNGNDFIGWFRTVNQRNCNQYYVCTSNEEFEVVGAAVMRCGPGLHVNPVTFLCENPATAGCDESAVPTPPTYPNLRITHECTADNEGRSFVHPNTDCFWFFCSGGQSNLFQCASSTRFNPDTNRCSLGPCAPPALRITYEGEFVGQNYENESKLINRYMELLLKGLKKN